MFVKSVVKLLSRVNSEGGEGMDSGMKEYIDSYVEIVKWAVGMPPECWKCGLDAEKLGCEYNPYCARCPKHKRHLKEWGEL